MSGKYIIDTKDVKARIKVKEHGNAERGSAMRRNALDLSLLQKTMPNVSKDNQPLENKYIIKGNLPKIHGDNIVEQMKKKYTYGT